MKFEAVALEIRGIVGDGWKVIVTGYERMCKMKTYHNEGRTVDIKKEFYNKLRSEKIKINWNKNPIKMKAFLSFLDVTLTQSHDHIGSDTGWTLRSNEPLQLVIGGGVVQGIEYLDSLQFGRKLSNSYNNYVNPFFLWELLSDEGKDFFIDYYKNDIDEIINESLIKVKNIRARLLELTENHKYLLKEVEFLHNGQTTHSGLTASRPSQA